MKVTLVRISLLLLLMITVIGIDILKKGSGLHLVNYFSMIINLGGYIFLTNELYDQLYMQNKEFIDQIYDYKLKHCSI
jgi:hypothetical protein